MFRFKDRMLKNKRCMKKSNCNKDQNNLYKDLIYPTRSTQYKFEQQTLKNNFDVNVHKNDVRTMRILDTYEDNETQSDVEFGLCKIRNQKMFEKANVHTHDMTKWKSHKVKKQNRIHDRKTKFHNNNQFI